MEEEPSPSGSHLLQIIGVGGTLHPELYGGLRKVL